MTIEDKRIAAPDMFRIRFRAMGTKRPTTWIAKRVGKMTWSRHRKEGGMWDDGHYETTDGVKTLVITDHVVVVREEDLVSMRPLEFSALYGQYYEVGEVA